MWKRRADRDRAGCRARSPARVLEIDRNDELRDRDWGREGTLTETQQREATRVKKVKALG